MLVFQLRPFGSGRLGAFWFMAGAVVAYSLVPLVLSVSGAAGSPFLFNCLLRAGVAAACFLFLLVFHRRTLLDRGNVAVVRSHVLDWSRGRFLLLCVAGNLNYGMFAWSVRYIDVGVGAVLFETWPAVMIVLASLLFRGSGRYRPLSGYTVLLVVLSLSGFLVSLLGQVPGGSLSGGGWSSTLMGGGLTGLGVLAGALFAFGIRWGADLGAEVVPRGGEGSTELFGAVLALLVSNVVSAALNLCLGVVGGESFRFSGSVSAGLGVVVFNVNYFCRLASIILAGSPPYPAPAAGPLRSGSWGR